MSARPTYRSRISRSSILVHSLLAFGAGVVWSFGTPAARLASQADAWQYLIWRSIGIIVVMETLAVARRRTSLLVVAWTSGRTMWAANVMLLLASLAYVYSVKNNVAANTAFLASMGPIIAVVMAHFILGERLTRITLWAVAMAFTGLLVMLVGDLHGGSLNGNISALLSAVGFAGYAVSIRTDTTRDWSPVLCGYASIMIVLCGLVTIVNGRTLIPPWSSTGWALFHGAVLIVVGTLFFNQAATQIPAVGMMVFAQAEMVLAPLWIFFKFDERPKPAVLVGGAIIMTAVVGKAVLDACVQRRATTDR